MPRSCPRIFHALMSTAWAVDPLKARALRGFALRALQGEDIDADARLEHQVAAGRDGQAPEPKAGVAVIPIVGTIVHRAEQADDVSAPGAVSAARLRSMIRSAANDESISAVVLDIESPGGSVDGVEEAAAEVYRLSQIKPVAAVANAYAASAAYWIASQASEVVVTPSGEVGSIGVYTLHEDDTALLEAMGVKIDVIRGGTHKIEANPFEPLSEEARAAIQESVDNYYRTFVGAVARGRGIKVSELRKAPHGNGRMVLARQAVEVGLADRVETIDETVSRLARGKGAVRSVRRRADHYRAAFDLA